MKLPCELIRDLLPLYAEHLTSPETGQLIEEHLQSCPACRDELHSIRLPVPVQAVRYRFPHFHAALAGVFGSAASSKTIAVSNTQLLAVVCADETLHYREGQPVSAYRLNGTIVYGTEQQLGLYPRA